MVHRFLQRGDAPRVARELLGLGEIGEQRTAIGVGVGEVRERELEPPHRCARLEHVAAHRVRRRSA